MKISGRHSNLIVAGLLSATVLACLKASAAPNAQPAAGNIAHGNASGNAQPSLAATNGSPNPNPPASLPALGAQAAPAAQATPAASATAATAAAAPSRAAAKYGEQASLALGVLENLNPVGWTGAETKIYTAAPPPAPPAHLTPNDMVDSLLHDPSATQAPPVTAGSLPMERLSNEIDPQKVSILQEFACSAAYSRTFQRGQRHLNVRIFEFATSDGAYGAYSLLRQGATTVVQRGDASSEDEQSVSFWQGRAFISISGTSQDDEESKNLVRDLADKIAAVLREHSPPPVTLQRLPHFDRVRASERIVMGPLSARRFFPAPYLQSVDFARSRGAAIADYQVQDPPDRLKMLLIEYPNSQTALSAYYRYTGNFDEHPVEVAAPLGGSSAVYRVNKFFILCQCRGSELIIITGARKKDSAMFLARYMF